MLKKPKFKMDTTDNPSVYRKARKLYLQGRGLRCDFCGYHSGENAGRRQKNWKKFRRTRWK
jgi:hypothetical protein